jgi:hypothetical protein
MLEMILINCLPSNPCKGLPAANREMRGNGNG